MVNTVSIKVPIVVGVCIALISIALGLFLVFSRSPGEPPTDAKSAVKGSILSIAIGSILGLVSGSIIHTLMFDIANPEIAATNFALEETRRALFGR